jgi:predicted GTPase
MFFKKIFFTFTDIKTKTIREMQIERTSDEIVIRLPAWVKVEGIETLLDYLMYSEATSKSKATQEEIDALAREVKKGWWVQSSY